MEVVYLIYFVVIALSLYRYFKWQRENEEIDIRHEENRKKQLKELIEQREERSVTEEYDEKEFWSLIDKIRYRSKESYKNHLGLLKDYLSKFSSNDLIKLDNLVNRLCRNAVNQDLYAASTIIFKTSELSAVFLLMSIFMTRGEVFFKQASLKPDFIIGKNITDVEDQIISDVIAEVYFTKTNKLIPLPAPEDDELELPGEKWAEKDLPSRFQKLWMEFA